MNSLLTRTISGAVFVAVMLAATLWHPVAFGAVFALVTAVMTAEYLHLTLGSRHRFRQVLVTLESFLIFAAAFCIKWGISGYRTALLILPVPLFLFILQLYNRSREDYLDLPFLLTPLCYIAVPFSITNLFWSGDADTFDASLLLSLLIMLWSSDVGAYIFGSLFGQKNGHRLFPSVSPKKSWEGFFGGMLTCIGAGLLLERTAMLDFGYAHAVVLGLLVSGFGTWGDLVESQLKRNFGAKDSGRIMPGHGGLLDRFDGALTAFPAAALYMALTGLI